MGWGDQSAGGEHYRDGAPALRTAACCHRSPVCQCFFIRASLEPLGGPK